MGDEKGATNQKGSKTSIKSAAGYDTSVIATGETREQGRRK
jgi:hypothetical protein